MLLVALALPLLAVAGLGPRGRGVLLLGLVALYVPLAGAGPSLQRAGVMGAAGIAAMTLSRPASRWYALLLAAAATLALNPRAWEDPGWQLSFAAVVGILCLGVPLARALTRAAEGLVAAPRRHPGVAAPNVHGSAALSPRLAHLRAALVRGSRRGHRHHPRRHPGDGTPARTSLRRRPGRGAAREPARAAGGRARHVARDGQGGARASSRRSCRRRTGLAAALGPIARLPVAYIGRLAELFAQLPGGQAVARRFRRAPECRSPMRLLVLAALAVGRAWRRFGPRAEEVGAHWRRRPPGLAAAVVAAAGARGHPRRTARVRPAGAARRAHRPLPRRRAGRRHAHPAPGRQRGVVRRGSAGGRHRATAAQGGRARAHRRRRDARLARPPRRLRRGARALRGRPAARRRRRQFGPGLQGGAAPRPPARTSGPCRPTRR